MVMYLGIYIAPKRLKFSTNIVHTSCNQVIQMATGSAANVVALQNFTALDFRFLFKSEPQYSPHDYS